MEKIIIGVAGEIGSGKDTVTKYLVEKYGASHHKFSNILRDILDRLGLEQNRKNMDTASTMLRQAFGENIFSRVICNDVEKDENRLVIMDGVRREEDLACVCNVDGFQLVYVETDLQKRYERLVKRHENTDDQTKTFEEFLKDNEQEPQLQIRGLKNIAQYVIQNDGTLDELYVQVDKIMSEVLRR
jgi:dephospho-CoA kinase